MHEVDTFFIVVGSLLLLGLATDFLGRKTALPRVTLLFLFGFVLGPGGFNFLPSVSQTWLPVIANIALVLVGFLLGGHITVDNIRSNGRTVFLMSISLLICTLLIVCCGLLLLGIPIEVALLLAGIATATDPATTIDVVEESGKSGKFVDTLRGIVAIDDVWGLVAFSIILAVVHHMAGTEQIMSVIGTAAYELIGAIVLGIVLGVPMSWISGRIKPGRPTLVEALGMVLLCGGIALSLEVSYLLASMTMGVVVTNLAKHHEQPFHEIEDIEWPFMILFFVLTGASLQLDMMASAGVATVGYIVFRVLGRIVGIWPGGILAKAGNKTNRWMGAALLPHAGVAIGMSLLAASQLPEHANVIITVVVMATIVFELIGPILCRLSIDRVTSETLDQ